METVGTRAPAGRTLLPFCFYREVVYIGQAQEGHTRILRFDKGWFFLQSVLQGGSLLLVVNGIGIQDVLYI